MLLFLIGGVVWFFYPQESSESEPESGPELRPGPGPSGRRLPALKHSSVKRRESENIEEREQAEAPPSVAQILPPSPSPLNSYPRQKLAFEGELHLVKGVWAYATKDAAHGEWIYSAAGLHYYESDSERASNVAFNPKTGDYGRLTGEFIFQGTDAEVASGIARELGLQKNVVETGMGEMIILFDYHDFLQNGDGLEALQAKYKDMLRPSVQYVVRRAD